MASRFSVEAIFRAVDKISKPLQKMGLNSKNFTRVIKRDFARAQRSVKTFTRSVGQKLKNAFRIGLAGAIAVAGLAMRSFIKQASKIEDAVAAFTPLLGGAKKANELVEKLNQTAATTPFQFADIAKAANQLLPVMNANIEDTVATFRLLGDTAGGNAQKLESITRGFTKAMLKGKVDLESLNMIAEAGVPIFTELAGELGVTKAKMFEMITAGEVTTDSLTNTFKTMTSEGGIFFKGMEIASKTFSGRMSTLKDNISLTAASIGTALLPMIKSFVDKAILAAAKVRQWVTDNQDLIKKGFMRFLEVGKRVVKTIGNIIGVIVKVVTFLKPFAPIIMSVVAAFLIYKTVLIAVAIVQAIFNAVAAANPIMLIVLAIGILIGVIIFLIKNWDQVVAFLRNVWAKVVDFVVGTIQKLRNKFSELLENPFFVAVGVLFAPWLTIPGLIIKHWEPIKEFFTNLWNNVIKPFVEGIGGAIGKVKEFFKTSSGGQGVLGEAFAGAGAGGGAGSPGVVTSGERVSRSISETTNRSEIIVRNNGSTAVDTDSGVIPPGGSIVLQPSG